MLRNAFLAALVLLLLSCRKEPGAGEPEVRRVPQQVAGFYLLNEGTMGRNNATLDYYDVETSEYRSDVFAGNPEVGGRLGDVGNDLKIYGGKLYAVMNCSNLVEVMNAADARHVAAFKVLNCRYITFHGDKAYVSSFAGSVQMDDRRLGLVLEFDTVNFRKTREVTVGFQPEEMAVVNGKLYVANSGGYVAGDGYDRTVSVIDLTDFQEIRKIDVDINLHHLKPDGYGNIYVSSRGDYYEKPSCLYVIDTNTDKVTARIDVSTSNFCIAGDTAYVYGSNFSYGTGQTAAASYSMVDVKTHTVLTGSFIRDGTDALITQPYGIAVNPSREVYIADAGSYTVSGRLYCFDRQGNVKSIGPIEHPTYITTGDTPAHIAFMLK